ncbi:hypothetical protein CW362_04830 [Streptomyces populi]|uniref:Proteinase inhibitor I42 chagasin domain-containing protein n=1 Tax=Streptomyces populi TaxID=2058924 RepID=A0A2I0SWG0_9ACTN|nr:hypothetical protein [Streptomyces populi]PKT74276.1 hypothetical protein CW362_04830 [Streptomyces populi]
MRRTTHTRTIALAALALLLAGCGSQGTTDTGADGTRSPSPTGGTATASPSPTGGTAAPSPSPTDGTRSPSPPPSGPDCAKAEAQLDAADTGHTYCLAPGDTIRVLLDGTTSRPWKPVKSDGDALTATNGGIVLQPGDASAAYRAVGAGTVTLTSSRPMCPSDPARMSCKGLQEWTVTVVVPKA